MENKKEVQKWKLTVDLAKQHVGYCPSVDILKNDIIKLIDIIESRQHIDVKQVCPDCRWVIKPRDRSKPIDVYEDVDSPAYLNREIACTTMLYKSMHGADSKIEFVARHRINRNMIYKANGKYICFKFGKFDEMQELTEEQDGMLEALHSATDITQMYSPDINPDICQ